MPDRPPWIEGLFAPAKAILAISNDDPRKIVGVAVVLCLVCSIVVSAAAIGLRPKQDANKQLERRRIILEVADLLQPGDDVNKLFQEKVGARIVDLRTGKFTDAVDPETFNARVAARDPEMSSELSADNDPAQIKRRPHYATVYLVKDNNDGYRTVIIPVHGYGLWSTLYGFLALKPDGNEIVGLQFYDHAETPGLGGEVDNPNWRAQWRGQQLHDEEGKLRIEVVKGVASGIHEVDGLAGATLTSRGVSNLVRFWAGEDGFGLFLENMRKELANGG